MRNEQRWDREIAGSLTPESKQRAQYFRDNWRHEASLRKVENAVAAKGNKSHISILNATQKRAIYNWSDPNGIPTSNEIRKYQKDPTARRNSAAGRASRVLERLFDIKRPYKGTVYRGVNVSSEIAMTFAEGSVSDQLGTSSWSKSLEKAIDYSKRDSRQAVVFHVDTTQGIDISKFTKLEESEVIHSMKHKWYIDKVETHDGIMHVYYLEVK